ncbi:MAG: ABC transporter permease, partial [Acidobacteriota bacterium]
LRLQMMEVAVLALAAGGLGLGLARLGVWLFRSLGAVQGPYWMDVRLDGAAVVFVASVTLLVALAAGLLPAWLGAQMASLRAGRGVTLNPPWLRRLVVAQVALGTAIGAGAWWLLGATDRLGEPLETLRRDDVVVLQSSTFGSEHSASRQAGEVYWRRVLDELESLPRVRSAAIAPIPGSFDGRASVSVGDGEPIVATQRWVTPGALKILDLPLVAGRDLRAEEMSSVEVVMIDADLAERLFGGDAIGRQLTVGDHDKRVIAVVSELTAPGAERGAVYVPAFAEQKTAHFIAVRLESAQASGTVSPALESEVRGALARVDPLAAVYWVKTMRHWMDHQLRHVNRMSTVFSVFAAVTLLLATLGLYGLLVLFVTGRRRELAIRQALGARPSTLRTHVLWHAMARVGLGVVMGLGLALWLLATLRGLFGAGAPVTVLAQTAVTFALLGLLAAWLPARQAGRADASGLRQD